MTENCGKPRNVMGKLRVGEDEFHQQNGDHRFKNVVEKYQKPCFEPDFRDRIARAKIARAFLAEVDFLKFRDVKRHIRATQKIAENDCDNIFHKSPE